jgi:hypothetical protein
MANQIYTSSFFAGLKNTLEDIDTDETDDEKVYSQWMDVRNMEDNYLDFAEVAGTGLAGEKLEGGSFPLGGIVEGPIARFRSRTFGQRIVATQEALEDFKYEKIISAAKRNQRSVWKLVEFDSTLILDRATNTAYVGADGQPLWSASHTQPNGDAYSNILETSMSPGKAALVIAQTQLMRQKGHDGLIDGTMGEKIVAPSPQWAIWKELLGSTYDPTPGAYNAINVVKSLNLKLVLNPYWVSSDTRWMLTTKQDNGLIWFWRVKPESSTWVDHDKTAMNYAIRYRASRGWVNPRAVLGVDA